MELTKEHFDKSLQAFDKRFDKMEDRLGTIEVNMATKADVEDAVEGLARIIQTSVVEPMQEGFAKVDAKFEQMDKRFEQVDEKFQIIDQRFDEVDKKFDGIDKKFEGVNQRFDGIDKKFEKQTKELKEFAEEQTESLARIITTTVANPLQQHIIQHDEIASNLNF